MSPLMLQQSLENPFPLILKQSSVLSSFNRLVSFNNLLEESEPYTPVSLL